MMQRKFKLAQSENKLLPRFSIRKVGSLTASVLIGISLFGLDNQAQAADLNNNEETILKQSNSSIYDDMTPVTSKYGSTIGQVSKEMNRDNALGIAGGFHIFANEAHLNVDTNGNVAANVVEANVDNGSRGESQNATEEDIYYIGQLTGNLNAGLGRTSHNHVVVGDDIEVTTKNGQVFLEHDGQETRMDHLNANDVVTENGVKYIDIENELDKLAKKSILFSSKDSSEDVKSDFSDQNNRYIDVSDAKPNESNHIYVDIPWEYLEAPQPIKIKGLSSLENAPTVIINVGKGEEKKTAYVQTQVKLNYDSNTQEISNGESHEVPNELLWNFGTELKELNFSSGRFMGSVLVPNATVKANVNVDGNIVADKVYINGGESHRWDLNPSDKIPFFPHYGFLVQPTQPTQPTQPSQASEASSPTQPSEPQSVTPTPSAPEEPESPTDPAQPTQGSESVQPTEVQPTAPTEPEQPTQASESSQPTEVQPTDPVEPTQPSQASEASSPTQPSEPQSVTPTPSVPEEPESPTDPVQPTQGSESVQPTEVQPTDPVEPTQPSQASEASSPTQPSEPQNTTPAPSVPEEPENPTESVQPTQGSEVQPTAPAQPTQASGSSQPTEVQPTDPVEPTQPSQASEASSPTQPIEPQSVTPAPSMPTEPSEIPSQPTIPQHEVPAPSEPEEEVSPTQPQNTTPAASTPETPESISPKGEEEVPEDKDEKAVNTDETSDSLVKIENKVGISPKVEESVDVIEEPETPNSEDEKSSSVNEETISTSTSDKNKTIENSVVKAAVSNVKTNSVLPETGAKNGILAVIVGAVSVIIGSIALLFKKKEDK